MGRWGMIGQYVVRRRRSSCGAYLPTPTRRRMTRRCARPSTTSGPTARQKSRTIAPLLLRRPERDARPAPRRDEVVRRPALPRVEDRPRELHRDTCTLSTSSVTARLPRPSTRRSSRGQKAPTDRARRTTSSCPRGAPHASRTSSSRTATRVGGGTSAGHAQVPRRGGPELCGSDHVPIVVTMRHPKSQQQRRAGDTPVGRARGPSLTLPQPAPGSAGRGRGRWCRRRRRRLLLGLLDAIFMSLLLVRY